MTASSAQRLHRNTAIGAVLFGMAMFGMAYAAVPLYQWFCKTTGFGGTTQVAAKAPARVLDRKIEIRFDTNVAPGLLWKFEVERTALDLPIGQTATITYKVTNPTAQETFGMAGFNVTPPQVGGYFNKIQCFCFSEQRLGPGETLEMQVLFFVDPAMAENEELNGVDTITLSYTFYPAKPAGKTAQESGTATPARL